MTRFAFVAPTVLVASHIRRYPIAKRCDSPPTHSHASNRDRHSPRALISAEPAYTTGVQPKSQYIYTAPNGVTFHERARQLTADGIVPASVTKQLMGWYASYTHAVYNNPHVPGDPVDFTEHMFATLLELGRRSLVTPLHFHSAHKAVREPFDYYKFGFDFASVLLDPGASTVAGQGRLHTAMDFIAQGHNVIFLSNHQSEGDPYAIDMLFDWVAGCDRSLCEQIHFMAGDRVRDDPVVMPFSAGRNLLTVYSKKHINDIPEQREHKLLHNKRTISETQKLFKAGGQIVWLAPSGGRDRRNVDTGRVEISPFDDSSIDMMRITAVKSGKPCHFYPMSLWTYEMLPPPTSVGGAEVGEERTVNYIPMHMHIGEEIDWKAIVSPDIGNKLDRRRAQREYIERAVKEGYKAIGGYNY